MTEKHFIKRRFLETGNTWLRHVLQWLDKASSEYANVQAWGLWIAAIATGLVAVFYAQAFRLVEEKFGELAFSYPNAFFILTPALFLLAWYMVYNFAPEAAGSGIPQVMAAVEIGNSSERMAIVDRLLSPRVAIVKVCSSLLCLAGGGAIGREGPTLQVSSAIFHLFGKIVRRYFPTAADQQTWLIAGSAAGLASAFNTPLGGVVYAIEELAATHFHRVRTALLTSVMISGLVAQTILGSYLYLGYPPLQPLAPSAWPLMLLTGFVGGAAGALFSKTLVYLSRLRKSSRTTLKLALATLVCGILAALLNYFEHRAAGPGGLLISDILFKGEPSSFTLIASRIAGTGLAYLSGAAGGIFSPSLAIGATIGSKIAYLFASPNVNLLAMLGMIGFLTGVTHTPFTSFILVLEMSDRHAAIFPMMIAAVVAHGAAKSIQRESFYEQMKTGFLPGAQLNASK